MAGEADPHLYGPKGLGLPVRLFFQVTILPGAFCWAPVPLPVTGPSLLIPPRVLRGTEAINRGSLKGGSSNSLALCPPVGMWGFQETVGKEPQNKRENGA